MFYSSWDAPSKMVFCSSSIISFVGDVRPSSVYVPYFVLSTITFIFQHNLLSLLLNISCYRPPPPPLPHVLPPHTSSLPIGSPFSPAWEFCANRFPHNI